MSIAWLIRYFSTNAAEILFSAALVTLVYSVARTLKAPPPMALAFAFSPLILAWSVQNFGMQYLSFSLF